MAAAWAGFMADIWIVGSAAPDARSQFNAVQLAIGAGPSSSKW